MLSGISPAKQLRELGTEIAADIPAVGQHLQDHPIYGVVYEARRTISPGTANDSEASLFLVQLADRADLRSADRLLQHSIYLDAEVGKLLHAGGRQCAASELRVDHSAGTCRMGPDETSVVDANLKVHGLERLRIADASRQEVKHHEQTYSVRSQLGVR
jgi:choline dehydrogenase